VFENELDFSVRRGPGSDVVHESWWDGDLKYQEIAFS